MQLVVLSNRGMRYLPATMLSIAEHVDGVDEIVVVDDSGDAEQRFYLAALGYDVVPVADAPAGYAAAMAKVFEVAAGASHFALWEEDFLATESIDLRAMAHLLDQREYLAQVAVLRQPWFTNELNAGGVLEAKVSEGHQVELVDGVWEHRAFFTCNPTVLPARTFDRPWPTGAWSESSFGSELLRDPSTKFAMLPGIRVEHVGERSGFDY